MLRTKRSGERSVTAGSSVSMTMAAGGSTVTMFAQQLIEARNVHGVGAPGHWTLGTAGLNWVFDAASLWAFIAALGHYVNPIELFVAYGVGNVLAAIPITPPWPSGKPVIEPGMKLCTSAAKALVRIARPATRRRRARERIPWRER